MNEVLAVLLDLYDTLAWTQWPTMRAELEDRFGIGEADLLRAFTTTRQARSIGAYGTAEGDLAAVLEAAGVSADESGFPLNVPCCAAPLVTHSMKRASPPNAPIVTPPPIAFAYAARCGRTP